MKLQEELVEKIEKYIRKIQQERDLSKFRFSVKESKTTNSIYIQVSTLINHRVYKEKFRISDHRYSNVKTKLVCKSTTFDLIIRSIDKMIKKLENKRLGKLINAISRDK